MAAISNKPTLMRAFILVLDSLGIGASLDAAQYGDEGAYTLGHIGMQLANNAHWLPHLNSLGLGAAAVASSGIPIPGLDLTTPIQALYGYAVEQSHGKDTLSGHWEIAGLPVTYDWGYFPAAYPSLPQSLTHDLISACQIPGILGNRHASGTQIIEELGVEHITSGKPIVYTSADSVLQIAAHETAFGLQRLYQVCEIARHLVDDYNIARVIARPFLGEPGHFYRTGNRHDYSTPPHQTTLLDCLIADKRHVYAIGKIADIFAHRGITHAIPAHGNQALFDALLSCVRDAPPGSLGFCNFVDFDTLYGHRRDVQGYAQALSDFDNRLPELQALLQPGDMAIITADHGCDPTWPGSDHTREHIPILAFGPTIQARFIGRRDSFADIGQSIAKHLNIPPLSHGIAFI